MFRHRLLSPREKRNRDVRILIEISLLISILLEALLYYYIPLKNILKDVGEILIPIIVSVAVFITASIIENISTKKREKHIKEFYEKYKEQSIDKI